MPYWYCQRCESVGTAASSSYCGWLHAHMHTSISTHHVELRNHQCWPILPPSASHHSLIIKRQRINDQPTSTWPQAATISKSQVVTAPPPTKPNEAIQLIYRTTATTTTYVHHGAASVQPLPFGAVLTSYQRIPFAIGIGQPALLKDVLLGKASWKLQNTKVNPPPPKPNRSLV